MLAAIGQRVLWAFVVLVVLSLLTFFMQQVIPGDPATLAAGPGASEDTIAKLRIELGLDQSLWHRYITYISQALTGNFGTSVISHQAISTDLANKLPVSLALVFVAMVINICVGVGLGLLAALRRGTWVDGSVRSIVLILGGIPTFWLALLLQLTVAAQWKLFPLNGQIDSAMFAGRSLTNALLVDTFLQGLWPAFFSALQHLALPAFALAMLYSPLIVRTVRANLISELDRDYLTLARSQGLSEFRVALRAIRNALFPAITLIGLQFGWMTGGTVLVEGIFGLPGIGAYAINAVLEKDLNAVVAVVLITGVVFVVANLIVDVIQDLLNPRLRAASVKI